VLFWHGDGYSTACGHGTIALGAWAVNSGLVASTPDSVTPVTIDVPSGRVQALVQKEQDVITGITFRNVWSHVVATDLSVQLDDGRTVVLDISYGGANYAILEASQLGLEVIPDHLGELVRLGREIKWKLNSSPESQSQADTRLNGIYGTIFYDRLATTRTQLHQRNVAIYADGRVDRSPCGSGTAARIAQLAANNELQEGMTLVHESIIGTRFEGRIADTYEEHSISGVIPEITGNAWLMAESNFVLVPTDPLDSGFSLR
jgi:proline racemase